MICLPEESYGRINYCSSGCETSTETTETESENQLQPFAILLTVGVLTKCYALQNHSQEEWDLQKD